MDECSISEEIKGKLEEYRALRSEMLYALRDRVWGVATFVVVSGAIVASAGRTGTAAYLAPIVLSLPFIWYTTYLERMRLRIHAYIFVEIEPIVPGLGWEKALSSWRIRNRSPRSKNEDLPERDDSKVTSNSTTLIHRLRRLTNRTKYILAILGVYDVLTIGAIYLLFVKDALLWQQIVGLMAATLVIVGHFQFNEILSSDEKYKRIFQAISSEQK